MEGRAMAKIGHGVPRPLADPVFPTVDSVVAADPAIMAEYAQLVENGPLRTRFMTQIMDEYCRTRDILDELLGGNRARRRPRLVKAIDIRRHALMRLHREQIRLLREWRAELRRGHTEQADRILPSLLVTAAMAAAQTPKPPAAQGTSAQEDKAIEAAIRAKLAKSKIGKDGFTVRVQGGVAYWDGTTDVVQHKGSATRMAKSAGARRVVNNIKISEPAKQKAADNLEQGRRRAQVKRSDPRSQP
jgi:hypothetical protein